MQSLYRLTNQTLVKKRIIKHDSFRSNYRIEIGECHSYIVNNLLLLRRYVLLEYDNLKAEGRMTVVQTLEQTSFVVVGTSTLTSNNLQ